MQHQAVLLFGSNMGNRYYHILLAQQYLSNHGIFKAKSGLYKTAAWGNTQQKDFYNQATILQTNLLPLQLLKIIIETEEQLGRKRFIKWEPRTIDIDIIFFDNEVIEHPDLQIPHPYMQQRRFVLEPISEILPDLVHPVLNKNILQLLAECNDALPVEKL
ncbi:MAG: 2-amino-4-hydroxy-6-hydroxymethyldihydropteridine diphosphokinase [Bacteroidia bacterium]